MPQKRICAMLLIGLFIPTLSLGVEGEPVGSITAIEGEVFVAHKKHQAMYLANLGDPIYVNDHIQTGKGSQVQILFGDESTIILEEGTHLQITEFIYSPEDDRRSVIIRMMMGRVRGFVKRYCTGPGSKYTIHTPTEIIGVGKGHYTVDAASR
jgi:hypothetical protein